MGVGGEATKMMAVVFDLDSGLTVAPESGPSNPGAVGFESARRVIISEVITAALADSHCRLS